MNVQQQTQNMVINDQIKALALHLDCSIEDAIKFEQDYLIYTDSEADKACNESIWDSIWCFNAEFLSQYMPLEVDHIKKIQELCEDANPILLKLIDNKGGLERDAKASDGRGHFLSAYDGHEHEVDINNKTYYIYKTN